MIEIKNVNKFYGKDLQVLKNVNLNVKKGEFVSILGPSGSGKSTLMNIVGCMDTATDGEYFLDNTDTVKCTDAELTALRNEKIGFVFQKYQLIPQYTVLQNIMLPLLIRGQSTAQAAVIATECAESIGLTGRLSHKPSELSGGQQQRVAIARALITKPAILLADEPTGALDSATGSEVLSLFKKLHAEGNTILMITHDKDIAAYAQRTVSIHDGVLM
ncbi:MAG: ABC transporter ATP-binding protein [Oscillospiraceae bacterium]